MIVDNEHALRGLPHSPAREPTMGKGIYDERNQEFKGNDY